MSVGRGLDDFMREGVAKKEGREDEKALHPIAGIFFEQDRGSLKAGTPFRESFSYGEMCGYPALFEEPLLVIALFESLRWITPQKCRRGLWRVSISHKELEKLESVHGAMVQTRQVRARQGDGFSFVIEEGRVE